LAGILAWERRRVKVPASALSFHPVAIVPVQKNEEEWLTRLSQPSPGQEHCPIGGLPNLLV